MFVLLGIVSKNELEKLPHLTLMVNETVKVELRNAVSGS
jgi:hypothetical protein